MYKETRIINSEDLRKLCIMKKWYTKGNNEEYHKLLASTNNIKNVTTEDILTIAQDIMDHSEDYERDLANYCFEIARICFSIFTRKKQ